MGSRNEDKSRGGGEDDVILLKDQLSSYQPEVNLLNSTLPPTTDYSNYDSELTIDKLNKEIVSDKMLLSRASIDSSTSHDSFVEEQLNYDVKYVTNRELWGFNMIGISSDPYSAIALLIAVPVLLEGYAAKAGFLMDGVTSCTNTDVVLGSKGDDNSSFCLVSIFGVQLDTSSFSLIAVALSVLLQAIFLTGLSSLADFGKYRKRMLLGSALIAALSVIALIFINGNGDLWLLLLLTTLTNVAYGVMTTFYYAYLSILTRYHRKSVDAQKMYINPTTLAKVRDEVGNEISSNVSIYGYFSCIAMMLVCGSVLFLRDDLFGLQICCVIVGAYWLIGQFLQYLWLDHREGPPFPEGANVFLYSWQQSYSLVKQRASLSNCFWYLLSWMLLSDASTSIGTVGVLFAKTELGFRLDELFIVLMLTMITGAAGVMIWRKVQAFYQLETLKMLKILSFLSCFMPIYGLLGLVTDQIGLHHKWEIYLFSTLNGFLSGALGSYSRVQFSELIPIGHENQFFGLYEITDNGSSWIGPFAVGLISSFTHDLRFGFLFIGPMLICSFLALFKVDVEEGRHQATSFASLHELNPELHQDQGDDEADTPHWDQYDDEDLYVNPNHVQPTLNIPMHLTKPTSKESAPDLPTLPPPPNSKGFNGANDNSPSLIDPWRSSNY